MKVLNVFTLLASCVAAAPAGLVARQYGSTSSDLENGSSNSCPSVILIFARASTEQGNMGASTGPALARSLQRTYRDAWIQGVGGPYTAGLGENSLPGGTSQAAIGEAARLFELALQKCPGAAVVTGGYSQGTAVIAGALSVASSGVTAQVKGAVLFGYTQNQQNNEQIPNYPKDQTDIFCNPGDLVCEGTLIVAAPHFAYTADASGPAAQFLVEKIEASQS